MTWGRIVLRVDCSTTHGYRHSCPGSSQRQGAPAGLARAICGLRRHKYQALVITRKPRTLYLGDRHGAPDAGELVAMWAAIAPEAALTLSTSPPLLTLWAPCRVMFSGGLARKKKLVSHLSKRSKSMSATWSYWASISRRVP